MDNWTYEQLESLLAKFRERRREARALGVRVGGVTFRALGAAIATQSGAVPGSIKRCFSRVAAVADLDDEAVGLAVREAKRKFAGRR